MSRNSPEIIPPSRSGLVRVWRWEIPAKTLQIARLISVGGLLACAGWLIQNFLTLRGLVNLLLSRIDLGALALCIFLIVWLLTIGLRNQKSWLIAIGIVIAVVLLGVDVLTPKPIESAKPGAPTEPFAISDRMFSWLTMPQSLEGSREKSGDWWVTYGSYLGETASPVSVMQYVEITNLLPTPETIRYYSLAVRTIDCGWTYLSPINEHGVALWMTYLGLENAHQIDLRPNGLNFIFDNPIPPGTTVTGWWLFDSKIQCNVPKGSVVQYKIQLETFSGVTFEYTTERSIVSDGNGKPTQGNTEGKTTGPKYYSAGSTRDISKLPRRLWSDPIPN